MLHDWQDGSIWSITAKSYWFNHQSELLITDIKCQKLSEFQSYGCNLLFQKLCGGKFSSKFVWQQSALSLSSVHHEWCGCLKSICSGFAQGERDCNLIHCIFLLRVTQNYRRIKKKESFSPFGRGSILWNPQFKHFKGLLKLETAFFFVVLT